MLEIEAPAKINLTLKVLGRRSDGFHEIETLMARVSVADRLVIRRVEEGGGVKLECSDPGLPVGRDNLVVRAAEAYFHRLGVEGGVVIELEKRIPYGAGLGGGSSDAAATLLGLNRMWGGAVGVEALRELAAGLGSDVPFFLGDGAAVCTGRGEVMAPHRLGGPHQLLLVKPAFGVETAWAYSRWAASREVPGLPYGAQATALGLLANDLERPVFEKHLVLGEMKRWLLSRPGVLGAAMSGSGSALWALLEPGVSSVPIERMLRAEFGSGVWLRRCETLDP